LIWKSEKN